jgi:arylsulfatase A-like enzyme
MVLWVGVAAGCGSNEPPRRNLLVITLDTTRADLLSCYGYPQDTTPRLDELARRSVLFERAYAPMAQTLPSHSTLFTGRPPRQHGALTNFIRLPKSARTLAEILGDAGYETAGFIGSRVLSVQSGIAQGFDTWMGISHGSQAHRPADEVTDAVLAWADQQHHERPFLAWVHYFDPHWPYEPPADLEGAIARSDVAADLLRRADELGLRHRDPDNAEFDSMVGYWTAYTNEVRFMDQQVGRLLDGLQQRELLQDTVVVVVGDHGEGLLQHDEAGHGVSVYNELVRVPLLVATPERDGAGHRIAAPMALESVLPMILELTLGSMPPEWRHAPSLSDQLDRPRRDPIFFERPHYTQEQFDSRTHGGMTSGALLAVLADEYKLMRGPDGDELYQISDDPHELVNLIDAEPAVADRLRALLDDWVELHPIRPPDAESTISPERLRALQELGYGGGR